MDNQAAPAAKQTKGIKKLWLKVKASMKNDSSSRARSSTSASSATPVPATASTPTPTQTQPTQPKTEPSTAPAEAVATPKPEKTAADIKPDDNVLISSDVIEVDDEDDSDDKNLVSQIKPMSAPVSDKEASAHRYQRAQEVFKKYDLTLDIADWQQQSKSTAERVEKQPRMRVRYSCHECKTTFGRDKKCSNCAHVRCNACVRYPPKKIGDKAKGKKVVADPATLPAPTTGACHECKTTFDLGATECGNCNHKICSTCLQETVLASPATAPPPAQPVSVTAAS